MLKRLRRDHDRRLELGVKVSSGASQAEPSDARREQSIRDLEEHYQNGEGYMEAFREAKAMLKGDRDPADKLLVAVNEATGFTPGVLAALGVINPRRRRIHRCTREAVLKLANEGQNEEQIRSSLGLPCRLVRVILAS